MGYWSKYWFIFNLQLFKEYNISLEGKHVVVIGRSKIVGTPVALLALHNNATVTICHSRSKQLKELTTQADILVAAIGQPGFITEDMVKEVIKGCWNSGGNPSVIMVGPFNKQKISGFTGGSTKFDASEDKTLYTSIDIYSSDFGDLEVVPNRFSRDRDAYVLDMNYFAIAFLRDFTMHELAKTGDSEKRQLLVEATLESRNEKASGLVADLTTS